MKIKLTLLTIFTLIACSVIGNTPSYELPHNVIANTILSCSNNEIEVIIDDPSYTQGDTYTINVYHRNTIHSETTNSLSTTIATPNFWTTLVVEVEKHNAESRDITDLPRLIATEVRFPITIVTVSIGL